MSYNKIIKFDEFLTGNNKYVISNVTYDGQTNQPSDYNEYINSSYKITIVNLNQSLI